MYRTKSLSRAITASMVLAFILAVPQSAFASCACPTVTDNYCLYLAQTGVGSWYKWGGANWYTTNREAGGADCSGYVIKAWQVPRTSSINENYHPYGTYHIFNTTYHWYGIGRSTCWKGDAVGYPDPDGSGTKTGHVVMFHYGDPYGLAMVYEAPGSGLRIRHAWKDISASKWRFRRRHNLTQTLGPG